MYHAALQSCRHRSMRSNAVLCCPILMMSQMKREARKASTSSADGIADVSCSAVQIFKKGVP